MIFGVGTDILELSRVQETYNRFGDHFVERLLMEEEREQFARNKWPVRFLAMRFAAKEATVKAMGTGFRHGIWIRDVGIVNNRRRHCQQRLGSSGDHLVRARTGSLQGVGDQRRSRLAERRRRVDSRFCCCHAGPIDFLKILPNALFFL
jgi:holo-[acyl-carrier protein] synthase